MDNPTHPIIRRLTRPLTAGLNVVVYSAGGGVSRYAFTFNDQPFMFEGQSFTYGAP